MSINFTALAGNMACLTGAAMYGGRLLLPLYLQNRLRQYLTGTGLILLMMGVESALILPPTSSLTDRYGPLRACLTGSVILLFCTAALLIP